MKTNKWYDRLGWIIGIAVVIPLVVAVLIIYVQSKFSLFLNVNDTILLFVGILATFVVVGNYAQVKGVENKLTQEHRELQKDFFIKAGYVQEHLYKSNDNIKFIQLLQAAENFSTALNIDVDKSRDKEIDTNIRKLIHLMTKEEKCFYHTSHKIAAIEILNHLSKQGYDVDCLIEEVELTQIIDES